MPTPTEQKTTRQQKGEALYAEGAVEVIEEWTRESASDFCACRIGGGRYEVEGSRGRRYELTVDAPALGAPRITCTCEDRRRGNAPNGRCKHAFAVFEHIRAANRDMADRLRAVRRRKAAEKATARAVA